MLQGSRIGVLKDECDCGSVTANIRMEQREFHGKHRNFRVAYCLGCEREIKAERRYEYVGGSIAEGVPENEAYCIAIVWGAGMGPRLLSQRQCHSQRGQGQDGLYCGYHAN